MAIVAAAAQALGMTDPDANAVIVDEHRYTRSLYVAIGGDNEFEDEVPLELLHDEGNPPLLSPPLVDAKSKSRHPNQQSGDWNSSR